jgi:N-acetylmuramoyl-L-alanine amidase CwlA
MMSVIVPEIITIKPTANAGAGADASDAKRHYQEESV